jgi:sugar phosphate isomerase/epimerase
MLSRRNFAKLSLAGASLALKGRADETIRFGVATESFHELPHVPGHDNVDGIIAAVQASGATEIDLSSVNTEAPNPDIGMPPPPPPGPYGGPPGGFTPAELEMRNRAVRSNLRKWRLATPPSRYAELKVKFEAAHVAVYAISYVHDDAFTNEELDATFAHAKALGVAVVSSRASLAMARRLVPFADRYGIPVAFRNDRETAGQMLEMAALSRQFRVNLDIGNFTAANQESVAFIQENRDKITHLIVKDRTRNNGDNEKFGSGDTPIRPVLALLREKQLPIRAYVDYEYVGMGTPQDEVRRCLAYVRAAL